MIAGMPPDYEDGDLDHGQRLLPNAIDEKAFHHPEAVWCSLPYDDDNLSRGYEDITYTRFANAINQMAWFIHDIFGPSNRFDTIAYMGNPDVRYHILQMAAAKTGYKILFSSHMNSLAGHLALFEKTNVKIILSASSVKVKDIIAKRPMKHDIIPELNDLLNDDIVDTYPYHKTFSQAKSDPFVILHTSGSTGSPKPIEYTLGAVAALDHHRVLPEVDTDSGLPLRFFFSHPGRPSRMLIPFLHFHGICSTATMVATVFGDLVYVPGFRHRAVDTNDIFPILEHCHADTAFFSPAMVEELARHPDVAKYISQLDKCLYGGAAITETAGKIFSQSTHLQSQWGITETTKLVDLETDPEDFAYCAFDLKHSGIDFVPVTDDGSGVCEMIVRRTPDSEPNAAIFWRCPDETTFRPGDLWSPHPDPKKSQHVWKYQGRTDDLICWKDGINFHPIPYESKHAEHELVRSAIMVGTGHRQAVLLLELHSSTDNNNGSIKPKKRRATATAATEAADAAAALDKIWAESIVPINDVAPSNGRVARTHVLVASSKKPFERSVKGTVARKATIRKYEAEIERVYELYGDEAFSWSERL